VRAVSAGDELDPPGRHRELLGGDLQQRV